MTVFNLVRSEAGAVEAAAGIETRAPRTRRTTLRRYGLSLLSALLVATSIPAVASNAPVGSVSVGSLGGGRMISVGRMGARHTPSVVSLQRSRSGREGVARQFGRFHHRDRDMFADGFFPFGFFPGFGWPDQPDLAAADQGDQPDWRSLPFWARVDRYEPPTVEKAPSGVTIIRGPGSHHGILLR